MPHHTPHVVERCTIVGVRCKFCGSRSIVKYGTRRDVQNYLCRECGRKFTAKDTLDGMQTPTTEIGAALSMFYDGLSFSDVSRQLQGIFGDWINPSTIYRWVMEYSKQAIRLLEWQKAEVSHIWLVDETVIKIGGENMWYWDVIDEGTRFLIDTHLSKSRTIADVVLLFEDCRKRALTIPKIIVSDKLAAYIDGIEQVFGADTEHIQSEGMRTETNINLIERFHGTIKERTKVMRGLKTKANAQVILDGFIVHYNFFRPHMSLGTDTTPAEVAGINLPFNTWEGLLRFIQSCPSKRTAKCLAT